MRTFAFATILFAVVLGKPVTAHTANTAAGLRSYHMVHDYHPPH